MIEDQLAAWEAAGLRRSLREPAGVALSSNDYLGLATDPVVRDALITALLAAEPHGSGGSRLLGGHHAAFTRLENRFATWQAAEAALFYGSGFAANQGLLGALLGPDDVVVSAALNHASLIDALRLTKAERRVVPHADVEAMAEALPPGGTLVVESVYSMDGDHAPLEALAEVCADRDARLIVDEAHATGLYGPTGQGRIAALGLRDRVFASVHTAGKALGLAGAFVVGSAALRDLQLHRARSFVYSTAPPPFLAAGLQVALDRIQADPGLRARPARLAARLRYHLQGHVDVRGVDGPIVPVVVGSVEQAVALADGLTARGWDVRAIRPPTVPEGAARVRLVVHAGLQESQIDALAADVVELAS